MEIARQTHLAMDVLWLLQAFRELGKRRQELQLPIFAVHGTADKTTSQQVRHEHEQRAASSQIAMARLAAWRTKSTTLCLILCLHGGRL